MAMATPRTMFPKSKIDRASRTGRRASKNSRTKRSRSKIKRITATAPIWFLEAMILRTAYKITAIILLRTSQKWRWMSWMNPSINNNYTNNNSKRKITRRQTWMASQTNKQQTTSRTKRKTTKWSSQMLTTTRKWRTQKSRIKLLAMMARYRGRIWTERRKSSSAMECAERPSPMVTQSSTSTTATSSRHSLIKRSFTTLLRPRQRRPPTQMACRYSNSQTSK